MCQVCYRGTYNDKLGATSCKHCSSGTTSTYGATEKSWCIRCAAGHKVTFLNKGCETCTEGAYTALPNQHTCKYCSYGYRSPKGSSSPSACRKCKNSLDCSFLSCARTRFRPPGFRVCVKCPHGTIAESHHATSIHDCKPCPRNTSRAAWVSICLSCYRGQFTSGTGNTFCRKHSEKRCPSDRFANAVGDCMTCSKGFRFNVTAKRCVKCPPGSIGSGGLQTTCTKCAGNTQANGLQTRCTCNAGQFLSEGSKFKHCRAGTRTGRFENVRHTSKSCSRCPPGGIALQQGSFACKPCPDGFVADKQRRKCVSCPRGLVTSYSGWVRFEGRIVQPVCVSPKTGFPVGLERVGLDFVTTTLFPPYSCRQPLYPLNVAQFEIGKSCVGCLPGEMYSLKHTPFRCIRCSYDEKSPGGLSTTCTTCAPGIWFAIERMAQNACVSRTDGVFEIVDVSNVRQDPTAMIMSGSKVVLLVPLKGSN